VARYEVVGMIKRTRGMNSILAFSSNEDKGRLLGANCT
jgi:hypothetical protein